MICEMLGRSPAAAPGDIATEAVPAGAGDA
jgi:hypothetical protein